MPMIAALVHCITINNDYCTSYDLPMIAALVHLADLTSKET